MENLPQNTPPAQEPQSSQPPANTPQSTPPPDNSPKKNSFVKHPFFSKTFFILLGLIIIFGSIAGGIFLYQSQKNPSSKSKNPIQQIQQKITKDSDTKETTSTTNQSSGSSPNNSARQSSTSNITTNQTSNQSGSSTNPQSPNPPAGGSQMKTYTNSAAKFSLPYPSNLQAKEASYGLGVTNIEITNPSNPGVPEYQLLVFPKVIGKTIGQDFDAYYAMNDGTTKTISDDQGNQQQFTKVSNRTISGQQAINYKTTAYPVDPKEEPEIGVYIEAGNNIVVISTYEGNKATLDSMLANFKYPL